MQQLLFLLRRDLWPLSILIVKKTWLRALSDIIGKAILIPQVRIPEQTRMLLVHGPLLKNQANQNS